VFHRLIALALLVSSCGVRETLPENPAPSIPLQESVSAPCSAQALRFSRTEAEVVVAAEQMLEQMRLAGSNANFTVRPTGTGDSIFFWNLHVDLSTPVEADPRPAALAWFASMEGSWVRAEEYVPKPRRDSRFDPGGDSAGFVRRQIGGTPFVPGTAGREAFRMIFESNGNVWRILALSIEPALIFASGEDAVKLVECTPAGPPSETAIFSSTFRGIEFDGCEPVGQYQYSPQTSDQITWDDAPPQWQLGDVVNGHASWVPHKNAELAIASSNYWERIQYADCYCAEHAPPGFTLVVHALTGEVLRYFPGVGCVVC